MRFPLTRPVQVSPSARRSAEVKRFSDNLPAKSESGASLDRLQGALDRFETEVTSGKVTSPHPYGDEIDLKRIQDLRENTSYVAESWSKSVPASEGLGVNQLAAVFQGEAQDVRTQISSARLERVEQHQANVEEARKKARTSLLRGVGRAAATATLQVGLTLAGGLIGTIAGPPGMVFGALSMGTLAGTIPMSDANSFGRYDFREAEYQRSIVNSALSESSYTTDHLKSEETKFSTLANDAEAWAGIIS